IGGHLVDYFLARGRQVAGVDRIDMVPDARPGFRYVASDLTDGALEGMLAEGQPALCVHCAGSASVPASMHDPLGDFRGNVGITASVLDAIRKHSPQTRFVLVSS